MRIRDWLSGKVISVDGDTNVIKAARLMKENSIRCLPVLGGSGALEGIVTDRDLRDATPSKMTTLDMFELNYALSNLRIKEIMTKDPITVKENETLEVAAVLMLENRISHLPVLDGAQAVVGVVTQSDVFRALIQITGAQAGGVQFAVSLEDRPGSFKEVADVIRAHDSRVVSVLQRYSEGEGGRREVYIRIKPMEKKKLAELTKVLEEKFELLFTVEDVREEIEKRIKRKSP